ncbi:GCN5 family acetyltransferase [Intrasporangium oryzae NRRL B-24470]|uniref:GCN5 family acetyltransferase n=1 Tax=Intrasporangium oryzae NRRL B-24470 TaxID=1386089 RepID=W9GGB3_9MICO|nr:GNAT family N-acetyltransferase [Intrasporangium oryzae]EWT02909.1 GCN5 family acetyltransferase [Intrasporangium oryzae NRRL B-24470]
MIELVRPTVDLADSWWAMVDAFGDETIHGSSYRPSDREVLRDADAFGLWVDWLGHLERPGAHLPEGRVPSSNRWIVEDGKVVGTIAVRHELNAFLRATGGHIGYAVEPGSRRRGVARAALGLALALAARRGIEAVLVTCEEDNVASARTIEGAGGVLEDVNGGFRRYWVSTSSSPGRQGHGGGSAFEA